MNAYPFRPVMHGDAVALARHIYRLDPANREDEIDCCMLEVARADQHRLSTGRVHPCYGDGSVMVWALNKHPPDEPPLSDPDYCRCLSMVFAALADQIDLTAFRRRRGMIA